MLLSFHGIDDGRLLGGDETLSAEFWFGRGFAWLDGKSSALHLSLLVDVPRVVERTKRRDRESRFGVGYCDAYPFTASGLIAMFLAELDLRGAEDSVHNLEITLAAYHNGNHAESIAERLFVPLGFSVHISNRILRLNARKNVKQVFRELPTLLLTLDRRTRLFLSDEERAAICSPNATWIANHPAGRAIELALRGRPTPLRFLVPGLESRDRDSSGAQADAGVFRGRVIATRSGTKVEIDPGQAAHGNREFSKMNIDRKWLLYLPAPVSALQTANAEAELERPEDALAYFRDEGVETAVVEEKHMGSRGIVVLCKDQRTARERFGVDGETAGCVYTRNGRKFFKDEDTEAVFLDRIERVLSRANFWRRFSTDWVCLDGEVLPWAVKASDSSEESDLVEAGTAAMEKTLAALAEAGTGNGFDFWRERIEGERRALASYDQMFKHYRTEAVNLSALKFAPFHLLAVEGNTFFNRSHLWQMQTLNRLARSGEGFLIPTRYEVVETKSDGTWKQVRKWWEALSERHEEGLVVKPLPFVPEGRRGQAQPALKCRSREHLRLVYGPHYDSPEWREFLLSRAALQGRRNKHRRILKQFALSMEAVNRFVQRSSVEAVHECLIGVLAQEVPPGAALT